MISFDIAQGLIRKRQLLKINSKPVVILGIRDTTFQPVSFTTQKRRTIERSRYLITVQDYFNNTVFSIYDNKVQSYQKVGLFQHIGLKLKKVFSG